MKTKAITATRSKRGRGVLAQTMGVTTALAVWLAAGITQAALNESFESLNAGVSVHLQDGWFVDPASESNTAVVVNNAAVAFDGSQYLSLTGGGTAAGGYARHLLGNQPIGGSDTNWVFRYALRFEATGNNGFETFWTANNGPFNIVRAEFNSAGAISYLTNNDIDVVNTGVSIATGLWYEVSYRALPATHQVLFSVVRASDNAAILDQLIPMDSSGTPTNLYDVEFDVPNLANANHWLLDNVSVIPEPSLGAVTGACILGWLVVRRRG